MGTSSREYDMTTRTAAAGRTRDRLLRAARDHFADRRYDDVTLADIASAARVTVQTLLNHFGSKEGLLAAAIEVFAAEVEDLRGHVEPGDVEGAIDGLLREYETLGDANWRAVADSDSQPILHDMLVIARAEHRAWLVDVFGPHLPGDAAAREAVLTALFAATDVGTWKLLRRDLGCEPEATRATLLALVSGLVRKE
ncbi:MAG: TetR/AcrR family transcriptional regulator [Actinomycetales bacterium]|nr:TetR/AcrR family transcriptional regulator [Actinomycetales bacterium]